ncbi:hypothetical protein CASFOL_014636 [Castilleja foliolosa]|uniref:Uncharacterized protein n=1 Tax=Castilleja foliolosa TaxID=1961234 RepID=A0ABD3DBW6_9LAMI
MRNYDESETANRRLALPEDFELRGFIPLVPAQLILDFFRETTHLEAMEVIKKKTACVQSLANIVWNGRRVYILTARRRNFCLVLSLKSFNDYLLEPNLSVGPLDVSVGAQVVSKAEVGMEDADEVILFKPPTLDKHIDEFTSELTSFGEIDSRNENRSSITSSASLKLSDIVFVCWK